MFPQKIIGRVILRDLSRVFMQATKTQTNLHVFAGHTRRKFLDVTTIVQSCRDSSKTDPERG